MNTVIHADTDKNGGRLNGSILLDRISIHVEGRDKSMNTDYRDIVNMVADKLETLDNLIEFYWYARKKTNFTKNSINGLCLILADCVAELRKAGI